MGDQTANKAGLSGLDAEGVKHINSMHRIGRISIVIAGLIMIGIPTIVGIYFDALPGFIQVITTAIGLLALFVPGAVSETIAYTPILGSSYYLAQITGNIMNLKVPVATTALQLLDVEQGTEDADIVCAIAVSVSSFVTTLVVFIGVLLILPLQPILTLPAVKVASGYIVPALFGSLTLGSISNNIGGGVQTKGRMFGALPGIIIMAVIYIVTMYILKQPMIMALYQGIIMLVLLPVTYFGTKGMYTKGIIKVYLPGEKS